MKPKKNKTKPLDLISPNASNVIFSPKTDTWMQYYDTVSIKERKRGREDEQRGGER